MASTRVVGKNARLYVGDIALYLRAFEIENNLEINTVDATAYAVDWQEFELIDGQVSWAVNAFLSNKPVLDTAYATDAAYWETLISAGNFKTDPKVPITLIPGNTAVQGDGAQFMDTHLGNMAISANRNDVVRIRGRFNGTGAFRNGLIIAQVEQVFATGDTFIPAPTTGVDLLAAGATGVAAAYHCYKKTAGATFTVEIQDSTTSGGAYAAALTFDTFIAAAADYKEDITDAGKQFHRVRVNNGGASETLGIIVVSTNI